MELVDTILTSRDANAFFGTNDILGNKTLEATLRYIAIKSNGGDIGNTQLIRAKLMEVPYNSRSGNSFANGVITDGYELVIATPTHRGDDLFYIDANGWTSLEHPPYPVAALLSARASETRIYINAEKRCAIAFVRTVTDNWCDLFASCLFRILPWRFSSEEDGVALAKVIAKNNPDEFKNIIDSCCKGFDFAENMARRLLVDWESQQRRVQMEELKKSMTDLMEIVRKREQDLAEAVNEYRAASDNYAILCKAGGTNDTTFHDYFVSHKQLSIAGVYDSKYINFKNPPGKALDYCILETIEYYDEENFLNVYNTPYSVLGAHEITSEMRRILYGLFKERKGVLRTESVFRLTNLSSLTVVKNKRTGKYNETHLGHPHLVTYGCLGGNLTQINNYMVRGDWDLAIEQSIAAAKNLNMGDSTVLGSLVRNLDGVWDTCTCVITENGEAMTPHQFLLYLKECDKKDSEVQNG